VCTFFMCGTFMCARSLCVVPCVCTGSAHVKVSTARPAKVPVPAGSAARPVKVPVPAWSAARPVSTELRGPGEGRVEGWSENPILRGYGAVEAGVAIEAHVGL
jgi:hypothetical protein